MNEISLNTLFCGREHLHFERIDSTNTEAQKLCKKNDIKEGLLITAQIQQLGRGYSGNKWVSEAGKNITMTLVLKPTFLKAKCQFYLNQAVTLGIHDMLSNKLSAQSLKIKWPNDIFYEGKKLCGILIENILQGEFLQYSFIGIGLNVNQSKFPDDLKYATSLALITEAEYEINLLIASLCECIEARYLQLKNDNITVLQNDYMRHLFRLEEWRDYFVNGKKIEGRIMSLNAEGKLRLETKIGIKEFGFKEIEFVI